MDRRPTSLHKTMKATLEESLIQAQVTEGKRLFAIKPATLTLDSITAMMETQAEDVTLMMVRPPYLVIEATDLDPTIGTPIEDFADLVQDDDAGLEGIPGLVAGEDDEQGERGAEGEGFELTTEDWDNVLLLCNGQGDSVDDLTIEWLIKAGLAQRTAGGHPEPTALARNWTNTST